MIKISNIFMPVGLFVQTKDEMIEEQKHWSEEDEGKKIDFSKFNYWLTANFDFTPIGFDSLTEIESYVVRYFL